MEIKPTPLSGLLLIQPRVFADSRGYFFESYKKAAFEAHGIRSDFVQDNESCSQKNVLRGLHFQKPPFAQGKLVRVIRGSVLDVAVDIRKSSPTYGKHYAEVLSEKNKTMLYIPPGFAHGFVTLEDQTIFSYKCTEVYNKESEDCLLWNDKDLDIRWGAADPILSDKDKQGKRFTGFSSPF